MIQENIFTVKRYEVEHNPFEPQGKQYSNAVGYGSSTSPKKAFEKAQKMFWKSANGGTPILGAFAMFKGGKLIKGSWNETNQKTFESFKKKHDEDKELERLIAEEEGLAA